MDPLEVPLSILRCKVRVTYSIFKGVFRGDAVDFLNGVGRYIEPWWLTVINHQHLVVFLISCKTTDSGSVHMSLCTKFPVSKEDPFLRAMFYHISLRDTLANHFLIQSSPRFVELLITQDIFLFQYPNRQLH